jgi:ferredoxin-type protein NapH
MSLENETFASVLDEDLCAEGGAIAGASDTVVAEPDMDVKAAKIAGAAKVDGRAQGKRIIIARRIVMALIFAAVLASLAFDLGLGTPSSFGVGSFFLLCPLGGLEAMLASKTFIPMAAISMLVVIVLVLLFGRAWCSWCCPAPAIRGFFKRNPKRDSAADEHNCNSCSGKSQLKAIGKDSRLWVLCGVLIATLIVGLPIFCLVCPIGLTFGTVASFWHLIVDKQVTASCIVFPLALVIELVLYRKWCLSFCPIGGLLGLFGRAAKFFRPSVNTSTCLKENGKACNACADVCDEFIDLHSEYTSQELAQCTRCGKCASVCPTSSVTFGVLEK